MKVLISAPSLDEHENVSGISEVVKNITKIADVNFTHFCIGSPDGHKRLAGKLARNLLALFSLVQHLLFNKFDIYHSNTALNPPSIVRDLLFTSIAKLLGTRVLLHLHGGRFIAKKDKDKRWSRLIKILCNQADLILVLGKQEQDYMQHEYNINFHHIKVLHNCIDSPSIMALLTLSDQERVNFLFLGRLSEDKGVLEIVEAFKRINRLYNFKLTICGEGPLKDSICTDLSTILGDKFEYKGVVKGETKESVLANAHYILLPSRYEGMPMALLEAMGRGVVPIVTNASLSINELINNDCGIFVNSGDVNSLERALNNSINNKLDWNIRSEKAKRLITSNYDCVQMRVKLKKIYSNLL